MTSTATLTAFGAIAQSGCLLGKQVVADDASLTPLVPPSIIEEMTPMGSPLPGATIQLASATTAVPFDLFVYRQQGLELDARWFIDRQRPCDQDTPGSCGAFQHLDANLTLGSPWTQVSRMITLPTGTQPGCHTVDLYLAGGFQESDPTVFHLPLLTGDVAHARWFVIAPPVTGMVSIPCPTSADGQNQ